MKRLKPLIIILFSLLISSCTVYDYFFITTPADALNNKNFNWTSDTLNNIIYHYESNSYAAKNIEIIKRITNNSKAHILNLINEKEYREMIDIFIVESRERMYDLIKHEINAGAYPRFNAVYSVYSEKIKSVGDHEFNHIIVHNIWGMQDEHLLSEGFAVYSDDEWQDYELHKLCGYLFSKGKLLNIKELSDNFSEYSPLITYPQSGSFVKYLYEKYGYEKLKLLWKNGFDDLENIYNCSFDKIEADWMDTVRKENFNNISYELK